MVTFLIAVTVDDDPGDVRMGRIEFPGGHRELVEQSVAEAALEMMTKINYDFLNISGW